MKQSDLFIVPLALHQQAPIAAGSLVEYGGRLLAVVKVYGGDAAAPVILEELTNVAALKGQYALWATAGVRKHRKELK